MGTVVKKFSLLFAVIFIVAAFSIPVSAGRSVVTSGTVNGYFDYVLYSDGELKLTAVPKGTKYFIVEKVGKDYINSVKSVTVDLGDDKDVNYETIGINGGKCPATKLTILCSSERKLISNLHIYNFSNLKGENIFFPQGLKLDYVEIGEMGAITDLAFLNGFPETRSVLISLDDKIKNDLVVNCHNIKEINVRANSTKMDFSASDFKSVFVVGSPYVTEVYFPESCIEVYVYSCYKLKAVYIPENVESVYIDCFKSCSILTDIFYYGSKTKFDSIKTYELNDSYERVYTGTINSITGDRSIHCLNGITHGWAKDNNGLWYYLDGKSRPVTGWKQDGGSWYYFSDIGIMQKYWLHIDKVSYYLGESGSMKTGWQKINGKWYYFESSGAMVDSCWKSIGGKWYFFEDDGVMQSSCWINLQGVWYYLKDDGSMASNEYINGYWLNQDGTWTYKHKASWRQNSKGWWYGDDTGWYAKNATYRIDGKNYTFDSNGYLK